MSDPQFFIIYQFRSWVGAAAFIVIMSAFAHPMIAIGLVALIAVSLALGLVGFYLWRFVLAPVNRWLEGLSFQEGALLWVLAVTLGTSGCILAIELSAPLTSPRQQEAYNYDDSMQKIYMKVKLLQHLEEERGLKR